jgi:hypothetical protein
MSGGFSGYTHAARAAAYTRWAKTEDPVAATQPARDGFMNRFRRQADPDGLLPHDERERRATQLMKAHMAELASKRKRRAAPRRVA